MAVYEDTDQLYSTMNRLFSEVQIRDPQAAQKLEKARTLLGFYLSDPEASIIINGRRSPASFSFNDSRIRPEVDVRMKADDFHKVLLGDLRLSKALANGAMKLRGPAHKALALADLFNECQELYPEILRKNGINY